MKRKLNALEQVLAENKDSLLVAEIAGLFVERGDSLPAKYSLIDELRRLLIPKMESAMTREVYVLEEHSEGEGWYPVLASDSREYVESERKLWPDTAANPKRLVTYGPTTGWRPIATAPRDGTPVLYWSATLGHIVGNHPDGCVAGGWVFRDGRWYGSEDAGAQAATHWMPLPAPPQEETPA